MSSNRIKEKLSTLVSSQLPEFVRFDYPTFITFLEAYYEYLEQDSYAQELLQNIKQYNDIDLTVDSFVDYFIKQYISNIPKDIATDKKLLIKNIKDLYNTKGSKKSYELLIRLLFNKDVDFIFPYTQILKASDGKWRQKNSFFMKTESGTEDSILNKPVFLTSENFTTKYPITVTEKRPALTANGASSIIYEYFYESTNYAPVNVNDIIEYGNFKGIVVSIPNSVSVVSPGSGFKVGDILTLKAGLGNSSKVKVTKVNSTGGILYVQFITFGVGYTGDFYNYFSSTPNVPVVVPFDFTNGTASISDKTSGFVERGTITKYTYGSSNYFAEDYVGDLISEFFTDTTTASSSGSTASGQSSDAALYVSLGSKASYPGYYETNEGFLSDNIYLEDQDFYQPFSYVLKLDERLVDYKKAVLDLLHPAGTKLFGDLTLNNDLDLTTELTTTLRYIISNVQDILDTSDSDSKSITKNLSDSTVGVDSDLKLIEKNLTDVTIILDELTRQLTRPVSDEFFVSESSFKEINKNIFENSSYAPEYFAEEYTISLDAVTISDVFNYLLTATINISDTTSTVDSGSVLLENYAESGYFAEDYAGELTAF